MGARCYALAVGENFILTFKPQYMLFDSVEQMLAPKTLSGLLSRPITRVDCQPMNDHSGLAGGRLEYVDTDNGRFVLKRMSITSDWIMFSSNDQLCRSVTIWQYGLLDQLLPHLEHNGGSVDSYNDFVRRGIKWL